MRLEQDGTWQRKTTKGRTATKPRAATSRKVLPSARNARPAEDSFPLKKPPVDDRRRVSLALPGGAPELPAPRGHRDAAAGKLVDLLPDLGPDVLRQRGRRIIEACHHLVGRRGTVVKKATTLVPHQRAVARVDAVAELKQRHLVVRLPDEEVEVLVVKPAPARWGVVSDPVDFFQHLGSLAGGTMIGFDALVRLILSSSRDGRDIGCSGSTLRRSARSWGIAYAIQVRPAVPKGGTWAASGSNLALTKEP